MLLLSRRLPRVDDWVQGGLDWCGLLLWGGLGWLWNSILWSCFSGLLALVSFQLVSKSYPYR
jgi:hypothetical protein